MNKSIAERIKDILTERGDSDKVVVDYRYLKEFYRNHSFCKRFDDLILKNDEETEKVLGELSSRCRTLEASFDDENVSQGDFDKQLLVHERFEDTELLGLDPEEGEDKQLPLFT